MNSRFRLLAFAIVVCATQALATPLKPQSLNGPPGASASVWAEPAKEFGSRIASLTGPGTVSLMLNNSSSIPNDQLASIRKGIEAQLKAAGVQLRPSEASSEVRVTLSESARAYVWIAEVKQGAEVKVALVELPRTSNKSAEPNAGAISLHKSLFLSQKAPILDALMLPGPRLVVLGVEAVDLYDQVSGQWHMTQSFPIVQTAPFPRDVRGHLVAANDHLFDAYLPGTVCVANAKATALDCHASDDPWPLGGQSAFFNSARNFFTGLMRPGFAKPIPPFYSAAALPRERYTLWVFAGADNQARTWDGVNLRNMGSSTRDWGSDIVSVRTACGAGTQLLVTSAGDDSSADSLRGFEIVDREPALIAAPLAFEGPITALWPSADQASAVAVIHNLHQGTYDAYSVSVSCSQ